VPDADISRGEHVKEEPSDELISLESHGLLFIPICIVPPAERDIAVLYLEDTVIADSDPVGRSSIPETPERQTYFLKKIINCIL
jgi:hypothetical protein